VNIKWLLIMSECTNWYDNYYCNRWYFHKRNFFNWFELILWKLTF